MLHTPIGRFRVIGFVEGASLIILLFIAMPLKYWADITMAVTVVGSLHGFFFIIYMLYVFYITLKIRWSYKWVLSAIAAAFIPFGNIILDIQLQRSTSFGSSNIEVKS